MVDPTVSRKAESREETIKPDVTVYLLEESQYGYG
jgi:hypothetical protein